MTVRGSARLHFDVEMTRARCTAESHRRKCETVMKKCLFVFKDTSCHAFLQKHDSESKVVKQEACFVSAADIWCPNSSARTRWHMNT